MLNETFSVIFKHRVLFSKCLLVRKENHNFCEICHISSGVVLTRLQVFTQFLILYIATSKRTYYHNYLADHEFTTSQAWLHSESWLYVCRSSVTHQFFRHTKCFSNSSFFFWSVFKVSEFAVKKMKICVWT